MACRTAKVERVTDKSIAAKNQLERLSEEITNQKEKHLTSFKAKVTEHLRNAKVNDERELDYNDYIKTEYTSEFSLDKIAKVVNQSLNTISKVKNSGVPNPAFSEEAIESYTDLVNSVAEAAKSSSSAASSLTFSMNRLSPGIFAFLSAASISLKEEETFGKESVTSTIIFYKVIESIDDVKSETEFNESLIDSQNLLNLKTVQAQLTDQLAKGTLDLEEWLVRDDALTVAIDRVRRRLHDRLFSGLKANADAAILDAGSPENRKLVMAAVEKLSAKGGKYAIAVERIQTRIEQSYF